MKRGGGVYNGGKKKKVTVGAGIFNLSKVVLTDQKKHILDKGLKFVPPR